ncbi:MAG: prepilin-type N-terminal cleavage/methylation domain-containing protein [Candidatus Taylorbacteria bacterium]|nr:prepilin-type N-terminal cleavage/methylation domain-containing protein [Candidatus Taylorbacteria bacterium]
MIRIEKNSKGLTLIELVISIAVFSVIVVVGAGAVISLIGSNRQALSFQTLMDGLNAALEDMSRSVRVGGSFHCGQSGALDVAANCLGGDSFLAIERAEGDIGTPDDQVIYRLKSGCAPADLTTICSIEKSTNGGRSFISLTPPGLRIEDLKFYVSGTWPCNPDVDGVCAVSAASDSLQPKVLITIRGAVPQKSGPPVAVNVQTTVSQRVYDK